MQKKMSSSDVAQINIVYNSLLWSLDVAGDMAHNRHFIIINVNTRHLINSNNRVNDVYNSIYK